jgi:signal transduction histidine kinase
MLEWSAECNRIFALPQGAPLSYQLFLDCVHPDDRAYVDRAWRAAMAGDPYDIQHRIVADGVVKWVRERAELEFAPDWTPLRGIGTAQDITELKRHEDALLRSRQDLRELAAHHERIREEERTRIAREIHDELGQCLTALRMDAAMIGIRFGEGNPVLEHQVAWMKKTIDTTIDVVRNLATTLRPGALDMGLVTAAEWLLSGFEERAQIRCHLHAPREHPELDEERSTAAFRILQESLTNIARHAQATEVNVHVELVDGALEMDIRDDGVGFDHAEVQSRKTFGLMGMRERALQFGGEARIDSTPGIGTTIRIRIPCTREALDDPHPHW